MFVLSGLYQAPFGIDVAGILKSSSGSPFNAAGGGVDSDGDEHFDNRLIGTEKGEFLTENYFQIDLRLAKEFGHGRARRLQFVLEIFNLTNRANPFRIIHGLRAQHRADVEPTARP